MKLSKLVDAIGWDLVVCRHPNRHRDRVGKFNNSPARALTGNRVACTKDSIERIYDVSHEIAELVEGFRGHEHVFCTQANLLAVWSRFAAGNKKACVLMARVCDVNYTAEDEAKRKEKTR